MPNTYLPTVDDKRQVVSQFVDLLTKNMNMDSTQQRKPSLQEKKAAMAKAAALDAVTGQLLLSETGLRKIAANR